VVVVVMVVLVDGHGPELVDVQELVVSLPDDVLYRGDWV